MLIVGLWIVALLLVIWIAAKPTLIAWRRRKLRAQPFPAVWRDILKQRVPYVRQLPADLQLQLKRHIQVFLVEKKFVGCAGLEITDEIRVTIAAQACLLLLNRRVDYFTGLHSILVYPDSFMVQRVRNDAAGVLHEERQVLAGESWQQGKVILSWQDVLQGAAIIEDGRNVVIHEFAHQLDQEDGQANGLPILGRREFRRRWTEVFTHEFAVLQHQAAHRQESLLDHYGATDAAEFFLPWRQKYFLSGQHVWLQSIRRYMSCSASITGSIRSPGSDALFRSRQLTLSTKIGFSATPAVPSTSRNYQSRCFSLDGLRAPASPIHSFVHYAH